MADEKKKESPFDKFVKTITFNNGYANDGKDKAFNRLQAANVNSTDAIEGLKGATHQNSVRGTKVTYVSDDQSTWIDGSEALKVAKEQTYTVKGDVSLFCLADYLRAVRGSEDIRINKDFTIIVLGTSEENYLLQHEVTAPTEFEWKSFERGFSFTKLDLMGAGIDLHLFQAEAFGANAEAGLDVAEAVAFHQEAKGNHDEGCPILVRVGIEADVLLRGDILVDIGLGTPFR